MRACVEGRGTSYDGVLVGVWSMRVRECGGVSGKEWYGLGSSSVLQGG